MTTQELRQSIDKVLGNSIRCLLPSYWWKRLFHQVADVIDDNGIPIVESMDELEALDLPKGSIASVSGEDKIRFTECYQYVAEDANISADEWKRKATQVKKIEATFPLPTFGMLSDEIVCMLVGLNDNELESALYIVTDGTAYAALYDTFDDSSPTLPIAITSPSSIATINGFLSQNDFYFLALAGNVDPAYVEAFVNAFYVISEVNSPFFKGDSWEKLAKFNDIPTSEDIAGVRIRQFELTSSPSESQKAANLELVQDVLKNRAIASLQYYSDEFYLLDDVEILYDGSWEFRSVSVVGEGRQEVYVHVAKDGTASSGNRTRFLYAQSLSEDSEKAVQNRVVTAALNKKQDTLVSGENIKTINNQSILGSGNITIEGGNNVIVDSAMSSTSTNAVQNKVIKAYVDDAVAEIPVVTVDSELSKTSTNPVQNKVVTEALSKTQKAVRVFVNPNELETLIQEALADQYHWIDIDAERFENVFGTFMKDNYYDLYYMDIALVEDSLYPPYWSLTERLASDDEIGIEFTKRELDIKTRDYTYTSIYLSYDPEYPDPYTIEAERWVIPESELRGSYTAYVDEKLANVTIPKVKTINSVSLSGEGNIELHMSEIHKKLQDIKTAVLNNEEALAAALNDINRRLLELENLSN